MAQRQRAGLITPRSLDRNGLSVFSNSQFIRTASLSIQHPFHRRGAAVARAAHNRKDIRSKRIAGIFQFAVSRTASLSLQHPYHRSGAGGARGAHNSEVTGSNPVSGIYHSQVYRICHAVNTATNTSRCSSAEERLKPQPSPHRPAMVRQRVGYPLITGRTLDRNQPPARIV